MLYWLAFRISLAGQVFITEFCSVVTKELESQVTARKGDDERGMVVFQDNGITDLESTCLGQRTRCFAYGSFNYNYIHLSTNPAKVGVNECGIASFF